MATDIEEARERWDFANTADKPQRGREQEDLGVYEGERQWDSDIKTARKGMDANGNIPAVPSRPCLTINKVRDPIRKIQNDELQADLGMSITAADDFDGDIDAREIELREGLARRIQRQSNAKDARMWAANRAAICGRGWYGITTRDVDVSSDSFDQEIVYERFYDQFSVLVDPTHEQPDGSDIEYAFVGRDMPWDLYRQKFPRLADGSKNPLSDRTVTDDEWRAYADDAPGWVREDGKQRTIRVTRYWRYERESYQIVMLPNGAVMRADTLDKEALALIPATHKRERIIKRVKSSLIDGVNTLEEIDWPGRYIPIVKIVGEEIHVFDQQRRFEGLVRPAIDPQKAYNAMVSSAVEAIAMAPKAPWIVPFRAIENFQPQWLEQATRNWPALFFNDVDPDTGQPITPPQRNQAEPPIQAMALMIAAFDQSIMATIGQANLADTHPDVRSGAMASRLLDEAARGTSNYLANLIRSVHYEGMIVNDLLYPIYGRTGRRVSMLSANKKPERAVIGDTHVLTPNGSYNVAIEATKFWETKEQERLSLMAGIIEKSPEQLSVIGDLFFEAAGDTDMAKRYKAVLAPPIQEMLREGQPIDPRLQQAMAMGQQLAQEVTQLRADKGARMEQAQIKSEADRQIAAADNLTKMKIAESHDATLLAIEELKTQLKSQSEEMKLLVQAGKLQQEKMRTMEQFMEERRLSDDRRHERTTQEHDHAHELAMSAVEHHQALEQASHEAAVAPKPSPNGSGE